MTNHPKGSFNFTDEPRLAEDFFLGKFVAIPARNNSYIYARIISREGFCYVVETIQRRPTDTVAVRVRWRQFANWIFFDTEAELLGFRKGHFQTQTMAREDVDFFNAGLNK